MMCLTKEKEMLIMYELIYSEYFNINCTTHSISRAKERAGLNKRKASKMMEIAKTRGIKSEDCTWSVDKKFLENRTNDVVMAIAYNGFCFIYLKENMKCITMYKLPKNFGQKKTQYKSYIRKYRNFYDRYE